VNCIKYGAYLEWFGNLNNNITIGYANKTYLEKVEEAAEKK
jgi:hypothetical protein